MDGKIIFALKALCLFLVGVFLLLTLIDTIFPYIAIRLGLLSYLSLPKNETIVGMLEPKQPRIGVGQTPQRATTLVGIATDNTPE